MGREGEGGGGVERYHLRGKRFFEGQDNGLKKNLKDIYSGRYNVSRFETLR